MDHDKRLVKLLQAKEFCGFQGSGNNSGNKAPIQLSCTLVAGGPNRLRLQIVMF